MRGRRGLRAGAHRPRVDSEPGSQPRPRGDAGRATSRRGRPSSTTTRTSSRAGSNDCATAVRRRARWRSCRSCASVPRRGAASTSRVARAPSSTTARCGGSKSRTPPWTSPWNASGPRCTDGRAASSSSTACWCGPRSSDRRPRSTRGFKSLFEHIDLGFILGQDGAEIWFEPAVEVTYLPGDVRHGEARRYFVTRWSDDWNVASATRFREKWRLPADDAKVRQNVEFGAWLRSPAYLPYRSPFTRWARRPWPVPALMGGSVRAACLVALVPTAGRVERPAACRPPSELAGGRRRCLTSRRPTCSSANRSWVSGGATPTSCGCDGLRARHVDVQRAVPRQRQDPGRAPRGRGQRAGHPAPRPTLVLAGLVHSVYFLGEFGSGRLGPDDDKRARVTAAVGPDVEQLVDAYTAQPMGRRCGPRPVGRDRASDGDHRRRGDASGQRGRRARRRGRAYRRRGTPSGSTSPRGSTRLRVRARTRSASCRELSWRRAGAALPVPAALVSSRQTPCSYPLRRTGGASTLPSRTVGSATRWPSGCPAPARWPSASAAGQLRCGAPRRPPTAAGPGTARAEAGGVGPDGCRHPTGGPGAS